MRILIHLIIFTVLAATSGAPTLAVPDIVPTERVVRWVNVRAGPDSSSEVVAKLAPGDSADLVEIVPAWYHVRLDDGSEGYVSRAWTMRSDVVEFHATYFLHLIDVGTGLAVFVEGPGFTLLYDAGSNDDTARGPQNRVTAYLHRVRPALTHIDHVILSHPHRDHVELLPDVLAGYDINNVWDSGRTNPICGYRAFLQQIQDRHIPYHDAAEESGDHVVSLDEQVCYGAHLPAGVIRIPHATPIVLRELIPLGPGASLEFIHATAEPLASFNENSLVAVLQLGKSRILLMGDGEAGGRHPPSFLPAPSSAEGEVISCCAADLRADVLVVGHHGSKTSSRTALLDKTQAYVFLVSAGPTRYASVTLPDAEVIDELKTRGTVYRTDEHDLQCRTAMAKIGPDNDNKAGGCDNILVEIDPSGAVQAHSYEVSD